MRFVIRKKSCGSVMISSLDRDALLSNLREAAGRIANEHADVTRIVLFGSAAEGTAGPASDADVLIIVRESAARFIDRTLPYLPYFSELGVGSDVFVYTESERADRSIPLLENALRKGQPLYTRAERQP